MFELDQYQLLDFGGGEKVERWADVVVRRQTPSVASRGVLRLTESELRFTRAGTRGRWQGPTDREWTVEHRGKHFGLKPLPSGQIGIFPEQASNWDWIVDAPCDLRGLKALNLFGYTGGTTMALAQAGAQVTHVDAARNVVARARQNAELSGLQDAPIRWIAEDAVRFVEREIKRNHCYQIVVADPPSFGRGPSGETWKLERDLPHLLRLLAQLTGDQTTMIILSCHTPGYDALQLGNGLKAAFPLSLKGIELIDLCLTTADGRRLSCGHVARWCGGTTRKHSSSETDV